MIPTVNYHLLKACNYACKYCYATFDDIEEKGISKEGQKSLIILLAQSKLFRKINFAGGEPLLVPYIRELIQLAKQEGLTTSIVTNASLLTKEWILNIHPYLDILTLSIDSVDKTSNLSIGRKDHQGNTVNTEKLIVIAQLCHNLRINLKINTVVNRFNKNETLTPLINVLQPFRWKVLEATKVEGQNDQQYSEICAEKTDFENFCIRNQSGLLESIKFVPEPADIIQGSYLMVDLLGRFYDSSSGKHSYSSKILESGVEKALSEINVNIHKFHLREGDYKVDREF